MVGEQIFTYEDLNTVLGLIESLLNYRSLVFIFVVFARKKFLKRSHARAILALEMKKSTQAIETPASNIVCLRCNNFIVFAPRFSLIVF